MVSDLQAAVMEIDRKIIRLKLMFGSMGKPPGNRNGKQQCGNRSQNRNG